MALEPDLNVAEIIAPPARPLSADGTLVSILNSWIASVSGNTAICPNCDSLLSTPSRVKLLFVGRAPLAEITDPPDSRNRVDSVELPGPPAMKFPPPPSVPTAGLVTPGESAASNVKFLCGRGNSVICL